MPRKSKEELVEKDIIDSKKASNAKPSTVKAKATKKTVGATKKVSSATKKSSGATKKVSSAAKKSAGATKKVSSATKKATSPTKTTSRSTKHLAQKKHIKSKLLKKKN